MNRFPTPATLLLAIAIGLTGCGGRGSDGSTLPTTPAQPGYGAPVTDPYASAQYPTPGEPPATPSATPKPAPSVPVVQPATGSASPTPIASATPAPSPTPTPPAEFKLRVTDVKKTTSGLFWWKKAEITVQVQNPLLTRAQTGKLFITFFLAGAIVGQPLTEGLTMAPGDIKSFTFKATEHSDDANAQVSSDGN